MQFSASLEINDDSSTRVGIPLAGARELLEEFVDLATHDTRKIVWGEEATEADKRTAKVKSEPEEAAAGAEPVCLLMLWTSLRAP